ncbi:hypothetical protein J0X19_02840 [Hymenobacter sp. BT186]|uniref:Uncharacterized protein n=1 Tax=Hymenobacter telluris TaxID=2816474 RepID=A0A939ETV7_9BACT|nr:hypothetical protein [Hymenobacter telluris]MBO0356871.1 hypothetical protein [Hymenobacter telluris]MBW3372898.1 hypothetical protein [Hymenobacter norwichensis]
MAYLLLDSLPVINQTRELLAERGMAVLGAWALLNLLISGYQVNRSGVRTEAVYFHQMNLGWNFVNVALAVWGMLRAQPNHVGGLTLPDSLTAQFTFEKILLFNAGLDVAYVCIGSWLRARAASADRLPERLLGFGRSLWLQGGFLFVFDVSFYLVYHQQASRLLNLLY